MACRDCKWWDLKTLHSVCGEVLAVCAFDIIPIEASIPACASVELKKKPMEPMSGEGCPQHTPRGEETGR